MTTLRPLANAACCVFGLPLMVLSAPLAAQTGGLASPVVDSGQDQCYDTQGRSGCPKAGSPLAGQDAAYHGHQAHYQDNGDGTITDLVTGLMWEKGFHRTSWAQAPAQATAQNTGGHNDWRVPTIKELYSLIDFRGRTGTMGPPQAGSFGSSQTRVPSDAKPYIDLSVFSFEYPTESRFIDAQYLSATAYLGRVMNGQAAFFGVNFADGRIKGYPQSGDRGHREWYARYVRGNPTYGHNNFKDQEDGTILDRASGLSWTKGDSGDPAFAQALGNAKYADGRLDWPEALSFCENLTHGGQSDWRLPNAKELQSIVDYGRAPDVTDSAALDPIFSITAIRDPAGKRDWPYVWTSTSHLDGRTPGSYAVYIAFGRAGGYMGQMGQMGGPQMGPGSRPPPPGFGGHPGPGRRPLNGGPQDMGPMAITSTEGKTLMDVHGAGAQRSSPKSGDEASLPKGHGPQGDILRIYNYARCVRGGLKS